MRESAGRRVVTVVAVVYEVMVVGVTGEGDIRLREKEEVDEEY